MLIDYRLDKYIKLMYGSHIPQSLLEKAFRNKDILVNDAKATASTRVTDNDTIFVTPYLERIFAQIFCDVQDGVHKPDVTHNKDYTKYVEYFKAMIIYEDKNIIAINKPSGIAMQLGTKTDVAIDVIAKTYCAEARIVHRLDKDTSGVAIIAKNLVTARHLMREFQCKNIEKQYYAVVTPKIEASVGDVIKINKPILRAFDKSYVDYEKGKKAVTLVKIANHLRKNRTLVLVTPQTGRMHQIRVHLASIGSHIIGDKKYIAFDDNCNRSKQFMLHAYSVRFKMMDGSNLHIKTNLPSWCV